jgi:hypothetical protein
LGVLSKAGLGEEQSYIKAAQWYGRAAENGNSGAQFHLGVLYLKGNEMDAVALWRDKSSRCQDGLVCVEKKKFRIIGLTLIAVVVLWPAAGVCAESTALDLGGGVTIQVPVPDGFQALGTAAPDFRSYSENQEPPTIALLETYLTQADFSDVVAGIASIGIGNCK